jgi:hypothetical protein
MNARTSSPGLKCPGSFRDQIRGIQIPRSHLQPRASCPGTLRVTKPPEAPHMASFPFNRNLAVWPPCQGCHMASGQVVSLAALEHDPLKSGGADSYVCPPWPTAFVDDGKNPGHKTRGYQSERSRLNRYIMVVNCSGVSSRRYSFGLVDNPSTSRRSSSMSANWR